MGMLESTSLLYRVLFFHLISRVNRLSTATSSGRLSCSGLQPALVCFATVSSQCFVKLYEMYERSFDGPTMMLLFGMIMYDLV